MLRCQSTINNILPSNPANYKGYILNGRKEGFGISIWPHTKGISKLVGIFREGKAEGYGIFKKVNGDIYKGEFSQDKATGFGIFQFVQGGIYIGQWKQDLQSGIGYEQWVDGSLYSGNYQQGKKHGIGKYIWDDGSIYIGEWSENNIEGYGCYYFSDGRVFNGQWKDNQMNGYGEISCKNGNAFIGYFFKNKKNGFGIMKNRIKQQGFIGFWTDNIKDGIAKIISAYSPPKYYLYSLNNKIATYSNEKEFKAVIDQKHLNNYLGLFKQDYNCLEMFLNSSTNNTINL